MAELPGAIDEALRSLQKNAKTWYEMPDADRAAVARACRAQFATMSMDWVAENLQCLGIEPTRRDANNSAGFDPFLFVSTTTARLDSVAEALEGTLKQPTAAREAANGTVTVFPAGPVHTQVAPGCNVELWAGKPSNEAAAASSENGDANRGASIVLGAGNQNFLTTVDVIERAFIHKECVFLKHHPIRPFLAGPVEHLFEPLAACGAFASCVDADIGSAQTAFVTHPAVTHLHMTGAGATHDRIMATLRAAGREDVGFTSELGCVSPWIICPGKRKDGVWEDEELLHHATVLTLAFKSSCSMNCLSPKVLVLPSETAWPQRARFLELLKQRLAAVAQPPPYYPGAHTRWSAFEKEYPGAEKIEAPGLQPAGEAMTTAVYPGQDLTPLPSLLVDVGTIGSDSCKPYALRNEAFSPVLAVATVESASAEEYPMAAAKAVNEHLFGTLSCTIVSPDERDDNMDVVINELNYGVVAVNMWAGFGYANPMNVWGGAPGSYSKDSPQSGLDFIGNHGKVPDVKKGVIISPFLNKAFSNEKPIPLVVLDSLLVLATGKRFALPRILGLLVSRGFGLFPRRLEGPRSAEGAAAMSRARMCTRGSQ